jgi:hypothetical protein
MAKAGRDTLARNRSQSAHCDSLTNAVKPNTIVVRFWVGTALALKGTTVLRLGKEDRSTKYGITAAE